MNDPKQEPRSTFWQVLGSTLAALFGIQSKKNLQRDFTQGNPYHFITMGIILVVAIVLGVSFLVSTIIEKAG